MNKVTHLKAALIIPGVCLIVVGAAGSVALFRERHATRELRETNQQLAADIRAAQAKVEGLLAEKQELAGQLTHVQGLSENFEDQIAEIEAAKTKEAESEAAIPVVTPYQAQAYLGQKPLGWVWIIPQNLRKDPNTQRYVYEPVVWLDEGLRKHFVSHHTNVVERQVETQTYVNTPYYPQPVYYVSSPYYPIPRPPITSNCPPVHMLPSQPIRSGQPAPQRFNPGTGTVTAQRLATPAGAIKTRPVP